MSIQKIGVIGVGTIGTGIVQVAAASGFDVKIEDLDGARAQKCIDRVTKGYGRLVEKGKMSEDQTKEALGRITTASAYKEFSDSDIIIEAITENAPTKIELFGELAAIARDDALIVSNTSSISITQLAQASGRPKSFCGLHFFNPVPVMKLAEIIRGIDTTDETVGKVKELAEKLGKTPVVCKDSPGFVVNRILVPMINEAIMVLQEGLATAEDIDNAMKMGANHPIGPLALCDLVGNDVTLAVMEVYLEQFGDSKYRPAVMLRKLVEAGKLGRKAGEGFYKY